MDSHTSTKTISVNVGSARLIKVVIAILLIVVCFSAAATVCPPKAYAEGGIAYNDKGEAVHDGLSGDASDMNGHTWTEVRDARKNADLSSGQEWSDYPLGGTRKPIFDLLHLGNVVNCALSCFYGLGEGLCGGLVDICNSLFHSLGSTDALTMKFDNDTYKQVYKSVVSIAEYVIQPVSLGFLGLALVLELLQFSREVATNKGDHFAMAGNYMWILVKFSAVATLIGHTIMLTQGIYELFLSITSALVKQISASGITGNLFNSFMISFQQITYKNVGYMVIFVLVAGIMTIAVAMTVMRVLVMTVTRMFEIYVLAAFSGIPLTMVTSRHTREGGLRYFKTFAGVCLQAGVLIVMLAFAGIIMTACQSLMTVGDAGGLAGVIINCLAPIAGVLGVNAVLGKSREVANRIIGA